MTPITTDPRAILQHHLDQALYVDALAQFVTVPTEALAQMLAEPRLNGERLRAQIMRTVMEQLWWQDHCQENSGDEWAGPAKRITPEALRRYNSDALFHARVRGLSDALLVAIAGRAE